ncbi:MAG: hypothetical protein LCH53_13915 [Bacteroidetes bacterium]|nr:hypothetical protein [Bacteroidota bacterium]
MRSSAFAVLFAALGFAACRRDAPPPEVVPDTTQASAAPDSLADAPSYLVRGFAPSHLAAADAYLDDAGLQRAFEENLRATLATRLAPAVLPVALRWQARYLSSAATRPAFARLLADRLSEPELRALAATGVPPDTVGFDGRLVEIVVESRALGAYLVERRRPELEAMLREAAGRAAPPDAASPATPLRQ